MQVTVLDSCPMTEKARRSVCPVACTLDIIGDKWSMIVIRDLLLGATRFDDFLHSPEHIATNVLTSRLRQLEAEGLVTKAAYQQHPIRWQYNLTPKGQQLAPIMKAMVEWARAWHSEVIRAPLPDDAIDAFVSRLTSKKTGKV